MPVLAALLLFAAQPPVPPADPLAAELANFQPHAVAEANAAFGFAAWQWAKLNAPLNQDREWEWRTYVNQCRFCYDCWQALEQASNPRLSEGWRWDKLDELYHMIDDDELYGRGWMPPPAPFLKRAQKKRA